MVEGQSMTTVADVVALRRRLRLAVLAAMNSSGSNIIFRLVVGGVGFLVTYGVVAALWFAWQRKTFSAFHVGPVGGSAPDQAIDKETSVRDEQLANFMETTTKAVEEINAKADDQD